MSASTFSGTLKIASTKKMHHIHERRLVHAQPVRPYAPVHRHRNVVAAANAFCFHSNYRLWCCVSCTPLDISFSPAYACSVHTYLDSFRHGREHAQTRSAEESKGKHCALRRSFSFAVHRRPRARPRCSSETERGEFVITYASE